MEGCLLMVHLIKGVRRRGYVKSDLNVLHPGFVKAVENKNAKLMKEYEDSEGGRDMIQRIRMRNTTVITIQKLIRELGNF